MAGPAGGPDPLLESGGRLTAPSEAAPDTRIVLFGNSGAGKSTLAAHLARTQGLEHLDLDTLAWEPDPPPTRRPLAPSAAEIRAFMGAHERWVIEGCYSDLLEVTLPRCTRLIFLNPGIDTCIANCRARPWEPHKYASPEEQDASLAFLLDWVREYETRDDVFSLRSHRALFDAFEGEKIEHRSNVALGDNEPSTPEGGSRHADASTPDEGPRG